MKTSCTLKLYIDIGNSYTKFSNDLQLAAEQVVRVFNQTLNANKLSALAAKYHWTKKHFCLISSVNPTNLAKVEEWLKKDGYCYHIARPSSFQMKQYLAWSPGSTLGSDLFWGTYYVMHHFNAQKPLVLISFGTATTLTFIAANQIQGFAFLPGWYIAGQALVKKAQLLKEQTFSFSKVFWSQTTFGAINSGVINSHWLAIQGYLARYQAHCKSLVQVVMTGGGVFLFAHLATQAGYVIIPALVLKGLRLYYHKKQSKS